MRACRAKFMPASEHGPAKVMPKPRPPMRAGFRGYVLPGAGSGRFSAGTTASAMPPGRGQPLTARRKSAGRKALRHRGRCVTCRRIGSRALTGHSPLAADLARLGHDASTPAPRSMPLHHAGRSRNRLIRKHPSTVAAGVVRAEPPCPFSLHGECRATGRDSKSRPGSRQGCKPDVNHPTLPKRPTESP